MCKVIFCRRKITKYLRFGQIIPWKMHIARQFVHIVGFLCNDFPFSARRIREYGAAAAWGGRILIENAESRFEDCS